MQLSGSSTIYYDKVDDARKKRLAAQKQQSIVNMGGVGMDKMSVSDRGLSSAERQRWREEEEGGAGATAAATGRLW